MFSIVLSLNSEAYTDTQTHRSLAPTRCCQWCGHGKQRRKRGRREARRAERREEEEEEEEEESLFKADAVNEEDSKRDRATQV